jgi:methionyl aminopeptidase
MHRATHPAPLTPGRVSPMRSVPASIARPEYVGRPGPAPFSGSEVKDEETIAAMRVAGRLAAQALEVVGRSVAPGITTEQLDVIAHEFICDHGAYPSPLDYRGFPKAICTSVNEVICHGIPDTTVLREGDICNVDVTVFINGVHGDTNATFPVGEVDDEARALIERTHEAMDRAIRAVAPGRPINVIGRVIESYAKRFNYGVIRDFTGHGIGTAFHSGLVIPHYDDPSADTIMMPGMTFTIEPMIALGTYDYEIWSDGWTVVTADRQLTAQFEHTVLVTHDGVEVLTA